MRGYSITGWKNFASVLLVSTVTVVVVAPPPKSAWESKDTACSATGANAVPRSAVPFSVRVPLIGLGSSPSTRAPEQDRVI